jgi:hypothetical protein
LKVRQVVVVGLVTILWGFGKLGINLFFLNIYLVDPNSVINADLLPPVVAIHTCIVIGLCEHDIPTACDVESRR